MKPLAHLTRVSTENHSLNHVDKTTDTGVLPLEYYPLLDPQVGIAKLGNERILREILTSLSNDVIDQDLALIQQAHDRGDWDRMQALTHKVKGGATYGTVRMYQALFALERQSKTENPAELEAWYIKMLEVINDTKQALNEWCINQA